MLRDKMSFKGSGANMNDNVAKTLGMSDTLLDNDVAFDNQNYNLNDNAEIDAIRNRNNLDNEVIDLDLNTVIGYICDACSVENQLSYKLSRNLDGSLERLTDIIQRETGIYLDLKNLFRTNPLIRDAIRMIAKGFLVSPKTINEIRNPVKIVFLSSPNNSELVLNGFGSGVHKFRNKLAILSFDKKTINNARKLLGSYGSYENIANVCRDINLKSFKKKAVKVDAKLLRALPKQELVAMVSSGDVKISDLVRANISQKTIALIKELID